MDWGIDMFSRKFAAAIAVSAGIATSLMAQTDGELINAAFTWNAPSEVVHQLGYDYPVLGGLNDGWKTRKAGRYRAEASAG